MNPQATLVSAKRRKQNIEFGADASKTPCIARMLIFHMEPLMESMLMLQNMPHLWCKAIQPSCWGGGSQWRLRLSSHDFQCAPSLSENRLTDTKRYFQAVWPMPFKEVWKTQVPRILKSCWVAKSCVAYKYGRKRESVWFLWQESLKNASLCHELT